MRLYDWITFFFFVVVPRLNLFGHRFNLELLLPRKKRERISFAAFFYRLLSSNTIIVVVVAVVVLVKGIGGRAQASRKEWEWAEANQLVDGDGWRWWLMMMKNKKPDSILSLSLFFIWLLFCRCSLSLFQEIKQYAHLCLLLHFLFFSPSLSHPSIPELSKKEREKEKKRMLIISFGKNFPPHSLARLLLSSTCSVCLFIHSPLSSLSLSLTHWFLRLLNPLTNNWHEKEKKELKKNSTAFKLWLGITSKERRRDETRLWLPDTAQWFTHSLTWSFQWWWWWCWE